MFSISRNTPPPIFSTWRRLPGESGYGGSRAEDFDDAPRDRPPTPGRKVLVKTVKVGLNEFSVPSFHDGTYKNTDLLVAASAALSSDIKVLGTVVSDAAPTGAAWDVSPMCRLSGNLYSQVYIMYSYTDIYRTVAACAGMESGFCCLKGGLFLL